MFTVEDRTSHCACKKQLVKGTCLGRARLHTNEKRERPGERFYLCLAEGDREWREVRVEVQDKERTVTSPAWPIWTQSAELCPIE